MTKEESGGIVIVQIYTGCLLVVARVVLPDAKKDGVAEQLSLSLITTIPDIPCCHQVTHTNDRKTNLVDLANNNGIYDLFHILQS